MKSFRSALLLAFALSTSACGIDPESDAPGADALDTQAQAATTAPPPMSNYCPGTIPGAPAGVPSVPTPMSSIPLDRPFYPLNANLLSAYTVVVTSPADPNAFFAFGFDVRSQRVHFYVSGNKKLGDLRRLNLQLADDLEALEQSTGTDPGFTWGCSGQIGGPLIPTPGVYEGAWKVAVNNFYQLDAYLVKMEQRTPSSVPQ